MGNQLMKDELNWFVGDKWPKATCTTSGQKVFSLPPYPLPDCSKARSVAIGKEAGKQDGKMEIQQIDDDITKLIRHGTALVREKKEAMAATGVSTTMTKTDKRSPGQREEGSYGRIWGKYNMTRNNWKE